MFKRGSSLLSNTVLIVALLTSTAFAEEWHHEGWHGDIHRFHEHDYDYWRGGNWHHGFHEGRNGWWWIVGGNWYFYPSPVYPYPDPYTPPGVVYEPVPGAPVVAPPSVTYFCGNPSGYYPYVARCFVPWQKFVNGVAVMQAPVVQMPPQPIIIPPKPDPLPSYTTAPGSQREQDDRYLNQLAVEFQNVDVTKPGARRALKSIKSKVVAFHQNLFNRGYNAMDILRDVEGLEARISAKVASVPKHESSGILQVPPTQALGQGNPGTVAPPTAMPPSPVTTMPQ